MQRREIAVVGAGLAGTATALALAKAGFDTVLVAPRAAPDPRSTALIGESVAFLRDLGVVDTLEEKLQPLAVMRLVDDTRRLFRAPVLEFHASEIGLPAFGYNVLNADLHTALEEVCAARSDRLERIEARVTGLSLENDRAVIDLDDGRRFAATLVVAADGHRSPLREAAGITVRRWDYPQTAIVLNFDHSIDHRSVSTEFHTRVGPFTQVPLARNKSSLVWVEDPALAELYVDLKTDRLSRIVEDKMQSILGTVDIDGPIRGFALSGASVARMVGERLALVGEAAHAFPPIGAQGLNLGLRDARTLAKICRDSRDDPGRRSALSRYEAARRGDVRSRTVGVDLLNRSLLAGFLPMQWARSAGLSALGASRVLRRFAMREGLSPGAGLTGISASLREGIGGDQPRRHQV